MAAEQKDQMLARQEIVEEPPSPKKQKTTEVGAVEPPASSPSSSSLNPAALAAVAGDEPPSFPWLAEPLYGVDPNHKHYKEMLTHANPANWSSSDEDEDEESMKRDSAGVAKGALRIYNEEEGTNYVLDEPLLSRCVLFNLSLVVHANFTAKDEGNSSSSSSLFFSETLDHYGGGFQVVTCVKLDDFPPDLINKGCIYCQKTISHPPVENYVYGKNEIDDLRKFDS